MSIPFSGSFTRSAGIVSARAKEIKSLNLKACKKITVTFDPFHAKSAPTREFLYFLSFPKVSLTNANCNVKPDIVCNRAPPKISFQLIPSIQEQTKLKNIVFNCENLSSLEILQQFNRHVSALAPKEDDLSGGPKTKLEKKALNKGGRR